MIKDLFLSPEIDKALLKIDQMIRNSYDLKQKGNLVKLYTYISYNRQGITNQVNLKNKEIERAGAIESNVRQAIASYFKKETESSPLLEVTIPALKGPDQDKPWVSVLRKLSEVGYYN